MFAFVFLEFDKTIINNILKLYKMFVNTISSIFKTIVTYILNKSKIK